MARQPDAGKQQRWLDLMRRWHASQLSVREFCACYGVSEANFYLWRRVLRERGLLSDQPAPTQGARQGPARPAFVKLTVDAQTAAAVEVVLSERRLLRVRPGFDPDTLRQLVRLLEEPAC
jgi:transposase-like protein